MVPKEMATAPEQSMAAATSEIGKLPEYAEMQRESDCLPDRLGAQWESNNLPDKLGVRRECDRLPERLGGYQEVSGLPGDPETAERSDTSAAKQGEIQNDDLKTLKDMLSTPEGIRKLMEAHPEKAELWKRGIEALETLNNPDATDAEKRSALGILSAMQGQLLEMAVKDLLAEKGLSVESKQRTVEGQDGGTRPDVIARNDTDQPISAFGTSIGPEETISIECKCGGTGYLGAQLRDHIPNQLSGQIGYKVLLTTGDIRGVGDKLVQDTCKKYGAKLVVLDVLASDVRTAIKGVSGL